MCIYSFQATDEIQRLRRQVSQARSPSPSRAASAVLLRVESERDAALADLRRTNTQLDNLEDKLKVCSYVGNEESLKFTHELRCNKFHIVFSGLSGKQSTRKTTI